MKLPVILTVAALMFMAPAVFAADTVVTPPAPTGPNAKGLETTQPSKEMAKAPAAYHKDKKQKHKKTKPLSPKEREEMERRNDVNQPSLPEENEVK